MTNRQCLDCSASLKGRADKKFCDDACRNNHNNRLNSQKNEEFRKINKNLFRNRRILEQLIPKEGKARVSLDTLLTNGFNFNYLTHISETQSGNRYFFCYEYGYTALDEQWYMLVKRNS